MLIDFNYLVSRYGLDIKGVVHVGAHYGEEIPDYLKRGIKNIVCFEPLVQNLWHLEKHASEHVKIFPVALGEREDEVTMNISSNQAQSSSVLNPKKHLQQHPDVKFFGTQKVLMKKMNSFKKEINGCNYLSMDVQGYEYQVLLGADEVLDKFDYVYCEVNRDETYENNYMVDDIDLLLSKIGFDRVETSWDGGIWGDAFYVKRINEVK